MNSCFSLQWFGNKFGPKSAEKPIKSVGFEIIARAINPISRRIR